MSKNPPKLTAVIVDNSNFFLRTKKLRDAHGKKKADLNLVVNRFTNPPYESVVAKKAFVGIPIGIDPSYFIKNLEQTGWEVFTEETRVRSDGAGNTFWECDMDTQVTFELGRLTTMIPLSRVILVAGDYHYRKIIKNIVAQGIKVDIVFPSDGFNRELEKYCSYYYCLDRCYQFLVR